MYASLQPPLLFQADVDKCRDFIGEMRAKDLPFVRILRLLLLRFVCILQVRMALSRRFLANYVVGMVYFS